MAGQIYSFSLLVLIPALGVLACQHGPPEPAGASAAATAQTAPPAFPADGHRQAYETRAGAIELVFDANRGVYAVAGQAGLFYHQDRFYRMVEGRWEMSAAPGGPWAAAPVASVPWTLSRHRVIQARKKPSGPAAADTLPAKHGY